MKRIIIVLFFLAFLAFFSIYNASSTEGEFSDSSMDLILSYADVPEAYGCFDCSDASGSWCATCSGLVPYQAGKIYRKCQAASLANPGN